VIQLPQYCGHSDPVTRYCDISREDRSKDARAERCARDPIRSRQFASWSRQAEAGPSKLDKEKKSAIRQNGKT
jgi:hypothetical protein